jgi:hypothetical protein
MRYEHVTTFWTIILVWLAIQLPLALLVGKAMRFGRVGHETRPQRAASKDPRHHPGVVWC